MNEKDKLLPKHNSKAINIKEYTNYHDGSNADSLKQLFDRTITNHTIYGSLISGNPNSWFEFDIKLPCEISLGAGKSYSDSGGSTQGLLVLQKYENNNWVDYDEIQPKHFDIVTYNKLVTKGHYRFHYKDYDGHHYCTITEMCCTTKTKCVFLISSNNELYVNDKNYYLNGKMVSIKKENMIDEFYKFNDLTTLFNNDYDNKNCLDVILDSSKSDTFKVLIKK